MREKLFAIIFDCLVKLGYVSKQGHAECLIFIEEHKIKKVHFTDKELIRS